MNLLDYLPFSISAVKENILNGYGNILFNGFEFSLSDHDKKKKIPITLLHFSPFTLWVGTIDKMTWNIYSSYDSLGNIRLKCAACFLATPLIHTVGLILNIANRVAKLVSFSYFWAKAPNASMKERASEMVKDIFRILTTPLALIGLLTASAYGATLSPYNGRKLVATWERWEYSGGYQIYALSLLKDPQVCLLGLCFQPNPAAHLGGGNMGKHNAW